MKIVPIKLGQKVSFGLGRAPIDEVVAGGFMITFSEVVVDGKLKEDQATLSWTVGEPNTDRNHSVQMVLDPEKSAWLLDLIENKTQSSLALAARTARGE